MNFCIERKKRRKVLLFRDFENKKITQFFHTRQNFPPFELNSSVHELIIIIIIITIG